MGVLNNEVVGVNKNDVFMCKIEFVVCMESCFVVMCGFLNWLVFCGSFGVWIGIICLCGLIDEV